MNNNQPKIVIPRTIDRNKSILDFRAGELCVFIPFPEPKNQGAYREPLKGIYVNQADIVALLRANKKSPAAVQFIADMME